MNCPECGAGRFAVQYNGAVVDAFVQKGVVERVVSYSDVGPPSAVVCVECFAEFPAEGHPAAAIAENGEPWPSWEIE